MASAESSRGKSSSSSSSGFFSKLFGGKKSKSKSSLVNSPPSPVVEKKEKRVKTADSITWKPATPNVIHIGLSSVENPVPLVTGDPVYCTGKYFIIFMNFFYFI